MHVSYGNETSRYAELQSMALDFLVDECMGPGSPSVLDSDISQWLADIAEAHGSHGLDIVASLIRRMAKHLPPRPQPTVQPEHTWPFRHLSIRPQSPQAVPEVSPYTTVLSLSKRSYFGSA